jgi:hypothetical protein
MYLLDTIETHSMKPHTPYLSVLLFISVLFTINIDAQNGPEDLTKQEKKITIDSISNKLQATYVFPTVAKEMAKLISENLKKGHYKAFKNPFDFANQLTTDLVSVSHDKHLRVEYTPKKTKFPRPTPSKKDSLEYVNEYIDNLKRDNFGFKALKILEGNIGYLDLRSFADVEHAAPTAEAAMNFLSNSDAIIIDLRKNRGGSPAMIQLITSYLFTSTPVHLNTFYWRPTDSYSETWTLEEIQGTRSPNTPVYVLTSKRTFSAAEEFSYNLKHLKRATLIGEITEGGAHPTGPVNATEKFTVWLPSGRAINPITKTNWEGIGVLPDIEITLNDAL